MWGEPDRANIREILMTDSIHVASCPRLDQTLKLQFDNRSMLMHQAGWHMHVLKSQNISGV